MIKELKLLRENDNYVLEYSADKKLVIINKTINGNDLYKLFYQDMETPEKYVIKTELTDSKDKIVYKQICDLFKKIDEQVETVLGSE